MIVQVWLFLSIILKSLQQTALYKVYLVYSEKSNNYLEETQQKPSLGENFLISDPPLKLNGNILQNGIKEFMKVIAFDYKHSRKTNPVTHLYRTFS